MQYIHDDVVLLQKTLNFSVSDLFCFVELTISLHPAVTGMSMRTRTGVCDETVEHILYPVSEGRTADCIPTLEKAESVN